MVLAAVDIETYGLNAQRFAQGCYLEQGIAKPFVTTSATDLWEHVIERGYAHLKNRRVLHVYAHNHQFDFYGYADVTDPKLVFHTLRPFIASYNDEGKQFVNFLDLMSLLPMSLAEVGKLVGQPKGRTPDCFINAIPVSEARLKELEPYVINDAEIVLKALDYLKGVLKTQGLKPKRLLTEAQIGASLLLKKLKEHVEDQSALFYNVNRSQAWRARDPDLIHDAYRWPRIEAWKTGSFKDVHYFDVNSLFPYAATKITVPDLRSSIKTDNTLDMVPLKTLLRRPGVSEVVIANTRDDLGFLPVRLHGEDALVWHPQKGSLIVGAYTHDEIKHAIPLGYKVVDVLRSCYYTRIIDNPFSEFIPELYRMRKSADLSTPTGRFRNRTFKMLMNKGVGKLGQRRALQKIFCDSVSKAEELIGTGHIALRGHGLNYMYKKEKTEPVPKPYYMPIIPASINAYSRKIMYALYSSIPARDLIYTDTDSIIGQFRGKLPRTGDGLGQLKLVGGPDEVVVWGRKTYSFGDDIKISGARRRDIRPNDFKRGIVSFNKMRTLLNSHSLDTLGSHFTVTRNLNEQKDKHNALMESIKTERIFIDKNVQCTPRILDLIKESITPDGDLLI